jgi:hypothetical protein
MSAERWSVRVWGLLAGLVVAWPAEGAIEVGFGRADITPDVQGSPVWLAGYGLNRQATGVHDPLWARAVVLRDGPRKVALVSVDLVGLQYPLIQRVRQRLGGGYAHVLVSSTHNHEGPDVIGLWGPDRAHSGVDPAYLETVEARVAEAVRSAESALQPAEAAYGTAEDGSLLNDSRLPIVKDGVLRAVKFAKPGGGVVGLLVQWNCHPENLGSKNRLVTADFPFYTVQALERRFGCPVAYFTGAVGGLMSAPEDKFPKSGGGTYRDGDFEFARVYGEAVAGLAEKAVGRAEPLSLAPIAVAAKPVALPLFNPGYRQLRGLGVLRRAATSWAGDPDRPGAGLPDRQAEGEIALESEVAYLRLGDLHVAGIPGELYPELVYGQFQEPAEPNADFPGAAKEPAVMTTLPGPKTLLFGLANDEVGYIIPKRQWDWDAPFAYGRKDRQYGEVNSVGPEVAPILMKALADRVREVNGR